MTDPSRGLMFVSGTFNGNPLTTAAGAVAVRELTAERIDAMGVEPQPSSSPRAA